MRFLGFNITREKYDFVPVNDKGDVISLSDFGSTSDFSNITTLHGQALAYSIVMPIKTIINRRSAAFGNGKLWLLDKEGNEVNTREANEARALLKNPNPVQTWLDFYIQQKVYKYIFGYCPIYLLRPVGMKKVSAIYNILPSIFSAEYTGKLYHQTDIKDIVKSYKISCNGVTSELPVDDVYISRDLSLSLDPYELLPESRLCAMQYETALTRALGEAKYTIVARRGALGILSNEARDAVGALPITPEEKKEVQDEYRRYGLSTTKNQIIITSANLRWQQIGISVKDLMLLELSDDVIMRIADAYDYPYELLGSTRGVTFANKNEAKKQFYNDVVIPEATADSEALTKLLGLENCHVDIDFSNISILQDDRKQKADTLNATISALNAALQSNAISAEEYRIELSKIIDIDPKNIVNNGQQQTATTEDGKQADSV
jgi:hypothetical protein